MKIDYCNKPDIAGKPVPVALAILSDKLGDVIELVMRLNNEVEDLKAKVRD